MITGVEAAGLALAIPGVVNLVIQYGEWVHGKIETFHNAGTIWKELGEFGWSLTQKEMKMSLELVKSFCADRGQDAEARESLELQTRKLQAQIMETASFLKGQEPTYLLGRARFSMSGNRRAKELNKALYSTRKSLLNSLTLIDLQKRTISPEILLDESRLKLYQSDGYTPVPYASYLFTARGSYRKDPLNEAWKETEILVEKALTGETLEGDRLKTVAEHCHYPIAKGVSVQGILPCLGYRIKPAYELIFKRPSGHMRTLETLIVEEGPEARCPLDARFQLARKLSEAVQHISAANLLHKSIRTGTILIVGTDTTDTNPNRLNAAGFGDVYLTNCLLLRGHDDGSVRKGSLSWLENLYRHPERQGDKLKVDYNLIHDIYSLGVCLLEVGIWDVLAYDRGEGLHISSHLKRAAGIDDYEDLETVLQPKLGQPTDIRATLIKLAESTLPQRMGLAYYHLVRSCLDSFERTDRSGTEADFRNMTLEEQGVAFKELVLSTFSNLFP